MSEQHAQKEDAQQIRSLFRKVWEDEAKGDPSSAIEACAPDIVAYAAFFGGPEFWTVEMVGLDAILKHNTPEEKLREWHATWAKPATGSHGEEVLHVDVKDDRAIALTQKWRAQPDATVREDILTQYQEVVMLAKIEGEWKMTNSIVGINYEQKINKWGKER
jgi:hypothetical protein